MKKNQTKFDIVFIKKIIDCEIHHHGNRNITLNTNVCNKRRPETSNL